jgi:L,D-transpeptidase ErfK/SrfK
MSLRVPAVLAAVTVLGACSLIEAVFRPPDTAATEPPSSSAAAPQAPLETNRFVLADGEDTVGELQISVARVADTFVEFARSYDLGFDELRDANPGVDPWLPGEGTSIVLPTRFVLPDAPREGIVLNVATKRLFYYPPVVDGEPRVVETYPIGIGREDWATPTGATTVVARTRDPVWFVPASIRKEHAEMGDPLPPQVPPGPDNPLGSRVLQLGLPGYLIHGTNKPAGVGMRVSHGCVRLYPEDIEFLYDRIPVGTPVAIVNQPLLLGHSDNDLLLEAHPPLAEDDRDLLPELAERVAARASEMPNGMAAVDPSRLDLVAEEHRGFPVSVLAGGDDAAATLRRARWVENVIVHEAVEQVADTAADSPLAASEN